MKGRKRRLGLLAGRFKVPAGFDAPLRSAILSEVVYAEGL